MNQGSFQRAPEAFHRRIVVTVGPPAHAANRPGLRQRQPVSLTGVLDAPVGVMQQPRRRVTMRQRHVQRRQWQRGGQRLAHRPADATARAPVQNTGHIQPAFIRLAHR